MNQCAFKPRISQYFAIGFKAFSTEIINKWMHTRKHINSIHNNCFCRIKAGHEEGNILYLLAPGCITGMHSNPKVWQVALYETMSRLEPQVNNWHRHDTWHTMHWLLRLDCFCLRAKQASLTSASTHKKSVTLSVPWSVWSDFLFCLTFSSLVDLAMCIEVRTKANFQTLRQLSDRCVFAQYQCFKSHSGD